MESTKRNRQKNTILYLSYILPISGWIASKPQSNRPQSAMLWGSYIKEGGAYIKGDTSCIKGQGAYIKIKKLATKIHQLYSKVSSQPRPPALKGVLY